MSPREEVENAAFSRSSLYRVEISILGELARSMFVGRASSPPAFLKSVFCLAIELLAHLFVDCVSATELLTVRRIHDLELCLVHFDHVALGQIVSREVV